MRLSGRIFLGIALAFSWSAGHALSPAQKVAIYSASNNSYGPYTPPLVTNGLATAYGNSLAANAGGNNYAQAPSTSFLGGAGMVNAWAGEVPWQTNNAVQFNYHYQYGDGAQTTAGILARQQSALALCNTPVSVFTALCFTAVHTTNVGSTSTTALTVASATGIANGDLVIDGTNRYYPAGTTVVSGAGTTSLVTSRAPTSAITSGTNLVFGTPAQINNYAAYTPASTPNGYSLTDPGFNYNNTGQFSVCNDPANLVFMAGTETNDANLTIAQTLSNLQAMVNAFGPKTCNKLVVSGDGLPRGMATAILEVKAAPGTSYTVTNAATFHADQGVYYTPPAVSNIQGVNDGVALTSLGAAPCTPLVGQYCVNAATGVYTLNATDGALQLTFQYTWTNQAGGVFIQAANAWWDSKSCATFAYGGVSYPGIVGAQCKHPWLTVVPTYAVCNDGGNGYQTPFGSIDGLHPLPSCGTQYAAALGAGATKYVGSLPQLALPTVNNSLFSGNTSSATTALTPTCSLGSTGTNTKNYMMTAVSPAPSSANSGTLAGLGYPPIYAIGMRVITPTLEGVPITATVGCIDFAGDQIQLSQPATTTGAATNTVGLQDVNNVAANTVFTHLLLPATPPTITNCENAGATASLCGTPSTGKTVVQNVPSDWVFAPSAANRTDLEAGKLIINYGVETNTNGDGYDSVIWQVGGTVHTGAISLSLALSNPGAMGQLFTAGDSHRITCKVQISAGPNGHLWGMQWPATIVADQVGSGTFTPPGLGTNTYTNSTMTGGSGGTGIEMTDKDLLNGFSGTITLQQTSPNTYTVGMTSPGTTPKFTIVSDTPGSQDIPVSATIRFSRCADYVVTS